jgi:hypothetical protein
MAFRIFRQSKALKRNQKPASPIQKKQRKSKNDAGTNKQY